MAAGGNAAGYFYPRSPCGERPLRRMSYKLFLPFLSTLSLRRATQLQYSTGLATIISIHALLAESDLVALGKSAAVHPFLSTLSLRRATPSLIFTYFAAFYFYPRSPCGERRRRFAAWTGCLRISIHALLAESDDEGRRWDKDLLRFLSTLSLRRATVSISRSGGFTPFLSTLSLRRATFNPLKTFIILAFLSTLSLRRATWLRCWKLAARDISIHALLAESDERNQGKRGQIQISIHALLAESDILNDIL